MLAAKNSLFHTFAPTPKDPNIPPSPKTMYIFNHKPKLTRIHNEPSTQPPSPDSFPSKIETLDVTLGGGGGGGGGDPRGVLINSGSLKVPVFLSLESILAQYHYKLYLTHSDFNFLISAVIFLTFFVSYLILSSWNSST